MYYEWYLQDLEENGFRKFIGASKKGKGDDRVYPSHIQSLIE